MQVFEKIIEKLEEEKGEDVCRKIDCDDCTYNEECYTGEMSYNVVIDNAIEIIKQAEAEYKGGWIPCSERLPEERDWYLAIFEEVDTGFIGLPFIADYLMGKHTKYTTDDGWIIKDCTDTDTYRDEYYKKLKCVAWQPLPEPYREERCEE